MHQCKISMADTTNQYAFTGQRPGYLESIEQSRFWQRLDDLSRDELNRGQRDAIRHVIASVGKVAKSAKWISTTVCRYMPQYTLHEERHFLNVLGIMDALIPDQVMGELGPMDCALAILAAFTHDLGMALSEAEKDKLFDKSTEEGKHFASYKTRFDEEVRQIERWRKRYDELNNAADDESKKIRAQARKRIDAIEGHILASYLRDTHTADDQLRRLRTWLDDIKKETGDANVFRYGVGGKDYQRELTVIGISHGRDAPWLRRQLIDGGPDDRFFQPVATGESANLAFPGLLLRLADVMDFDASRAPRILFKHFGIENDQSVLEWNKHLSIVGWRLDVDPDGKQQPELLYTAEWRHPVHEKAIREFKTWIDAELSAVRIELDAQRRQLPFLWHGRPDRDSATDHGRDARATHRYDLHLPSQTRLDIRPARDPLTDQPKYVYHDLQFRLDQDEIQQLLMGESLYGDPGLCIRELLQNALDALELRELRLKMKQKGEPREPVDGELIRHGWVREPDGREEELRVTLDWGTDEETGQQWLRVTDNGVGMTEEVIKNYFTQIGKSYYRNDPSFSSERDAMVSAGESISPISQFGIGIVSCFMIADRIRVRTCPGTEIQSYDVRIDGAGSLFWIQTGTRKSQGTEIEVFLKPDCQLECDENTLLDRLRAHFGYPNSSRPYVCTARRVDPAFSAVANVVWPRFPVDLLGLSEALRIDRSLHTEKLAPINCEDLKKRTGTWGYPEEFFEETAWETYRCDVTNSNGVTQAEVMVWFPRNADATSDLAILELASCVETQLEFQYADRNARILVLVNGMFVTDRLAALRRLHVEPGPGMRLWIDLRTADVRLNTSRTKLLDPPEDATWVKCIQGIPSELAERFCLTSMHDYPVVVHGHAEQSSQLSPTAPVSMAPKRLDFDLLQACKKSTGKTPTERDVSFTALRFGRFISRDLNRSGNGADRILQPGSAQTLLIPHGTRLNNAGLRVAESIGLKGRGTFGFMFGFVNEAAQIWEAFILKFYRSVPMVRLCLDLVWLQSAFSSDLSVSWPPFGLANVRGPIGNGRLVSPCNVQAELQDDGRTVLWTDADGEQPEKLTGRGYDLTFPLAAVPLGRLRRECPEWRTDLSFQFLGLAPFVLPVNAETWRGSIELAQKAFRVPQVFCLLPRFELWSKRFSDWTDADWHDPENLSALWDLSGHLTGTAGQVLWARGTHDVKEMPKIGLPAPEFLKTAQKG